MKKQTQTAIQSPSLREMVEVVRRDPEFWLRGTLLEFADTGNPYYAWKAIQVCIEHKREFPEWLLAYLAGCAESMMSEEAKREGRDLRKVLPWIFGFPNVLEPTQRKRGPGNLLDPRPAEPNTTYFALRFAIRLEEGEEPAAAMRNACNDVFDGKSANADEKTLRRWLLKEFDLTEWPSNADDWKAVAREHHQSRFEFLADYWKEAKSRETLS